MNLKINFDQLIPEIVFFVPFMLIDPFTVVCSVPWHLNRSQAGGDLVLLQTFFLFKCESWYSYANYPVNMISYVWKTRRFVTKQGQRSKVYSKARALSTQPVKWSIGCNVHQSLSTVKWTILFWV